MELFRKIIIKDEVGILNLNIKSATNLCLPKSRSTHNWFSYDIEYQ